MFVETKTIELLAPELVLMLAATTIFVGGAFVRNRQAWSAFAKLAYAIAVGLLLMKGLSETALFSGPVVVDPLSFALRGLALLTGLVFTAVVSKTTDEELSAEFLGSLMLVVLGSMLTAVANEMVLLFLGLELISIPTYVLLFLGRKDRSSGEATMKYFFLSLLSSGMLLYGLSFLYGLGGTTLLVGHGQQLGVREVLLAGDSDVAALAPLALVLIMAGMGFKLAAAPFQFYAPDVYQGTTTTNAGVLAVIPKIAGIAGLIRLVVVAMPTMSSYAWELALILAVLTMTIGNICALWQTNIRRLLAYSSIAHGGYLLIGLAVASGAAAVGDSTSGGGVAAMTLYLMVYAVASMGTFATLAYLGSAEKDVNSVDDLAGLGKAQPLAAGVLAVFMFSFAGIPPLAGFWGKLTLFSGAIKLSLNSGTGPNSGWFLFLAIVAAINAAIAAAYYLRLVSVMFFSPAASSPPPATGGWPALFAGTACGVLVLLLGIAPAFPLDLAARSEKQLFQPAAPKAPAVATVDSRSVQ